MPEHRQATWGMSECDFLTSGELGHIEGLRAMGFDPLAQPQFWEIIVARMVGGAITPYKATHDVEVDIGDRLALVEVKYSAGFVCSFSETGTAGNGPREVFRWAKPRGFGGKYGVDAIVFVGRSTSRELFSWVVPLDFIGPNCPAVTITNPHARRDREGKWDRFAVPFDQILPAFLRIARGSYPAPALTYHERQRRRIADKAGQLAFEIECGR